MNWLAALDLPLVVKLAAAYMFLVLDYKSCGSKNKISKQKEKGVHGKSDRIHVDSWHYSSSRSFHLSTQRPVGLEFEPTSRRTYSGAKAFMLLLTMD